MFSADYPNGRIPQQCPRIATEVDEGEGRARGGVRKHKRRVIYLTDYEKSFPIASERRHRKPISLAAAFGVCVIHPLVFDDCHPLYVRCLDPRDGGGGPKARKDSRRSAIYSRVDFPGHPLASKELSPSSSLPLAALSFLSSPLQSIL